MPERLRRQAGRIIRGLPASRLRPHTVRARLALSIALVLAVMLTVLGVVMVQVARVTLIDQLDDQVLGAAVRLGPPGGSPAGGLPKPAPPKPAPPKPGPPKPG